MEPQNDILKYKGFSGFSDLVLLLGTSTKTNDKLQALTEYFSVADDRDKVWVIAIFSGRRPRRMINTTLLATWAVEASALSWWLFEESYHVVGDLAETIALLLPDPPDGERENRVNHPLHYYMDELIRLEKEPEEKKKDFIYNSWRTMTQTERFVFNKLFTGAFRIGVSQKVMVNALAKTVQIDPSVIAHRISGNWDPAAISFRALLGDEGTETDHSKPYPFYLAYALEEVPLVLGNPQHWQVEWKWDGIRGQIIRRKGELFVWSRGEELMTDKFPEYTSLRDLLPDGIALDGEIIPVVDKKPLPFSLLQTRIGRKNITKKQLQEAPIGFFVYDLLEYEGEDWRSRPLQDRRKKLEQIVAEVNHPALLISPVVDFNTWEELIELRDKARDEGAEGFMIKRKDSTYQVGRKRGDWWKWKVDPLTIDAVMVYAQKGAGRRSNLYTAYTFAVRNGEELVVFTRAYSGLTDKEFAEVDSFIRRNSLEKFGPVRTVKPELVFEIAFEGIAASKRHKSGVALRFPRMHRWRKDKKPSEINTLDDLKAMLEKYGNSPSS